MMLRILLPLLLLAACGSANPLRVLTPYKLDIQQGNALSPEAVAKVRTGMTSSQVRFILGTPLVVDAFHSGRWDYVYQLDKGGHRKEARRLTLLFENDKLKQIEEVDLLKAAADQGAKP
jgi:outer membrane protein assembly factor BamE